METNGNVNVGKRKKRKTKKNRIKKERKKLLLAHLTDYSTLWKKTKKTNDYSLF